MVPYVLLVSLKFCSVENKGEMVALKVWQGRVIHYHWIQARWGLLMFCRCDGVQLTCNATFVSGGRHNDWTILYVRLGSRQA